MQMKKSTKIKLYVTIAVILLVAIVVPNTPLVLADKPFPYYGEVDFSGTISLNYSGDFADGVKVELLEDGQWKTHDYTDENGSYFFTYTVQRFKFYSIRISKNGYNTDSNSVIPTSSDHEEDYTLYGKVALFLWASDAANKTIMDELGNQLVENESFTGLLFYEDKQNWQNAIDDLDNLETYYSQVFIYLIGHGEMNIMISFCHIVILRG